MKRVRVKAHDDRDRERAKRLERYLNSARARGDVCAEVARAFVNLVLYGPDRTRWPS